MPYQGTLLPVSFASHVCLTSLRRLREKLAWCAASSEDWSSVFLCATGCTFFDWQLRLPYIGTWGFALSTRGSPATDKWRPNQTILYLPRYRIRGTALGKQNNERGELRMKEREIKHVARLLG